MAGCCLVQNEHSTFISDLYSSCWSWGAISFGILSILSVMIKRLFSLNMCSARHNPQQTSWAVCFIQGSSPHDVRDSGTYPADLSLGGMVEIVILSSVLDVHQGPWWQHGMCFIYPQMLTKRKMVAKKAINWDNSTPELVPFRKMFGAVRLFVALVDYDILSHPSY